MNSKEIIDRYIGALEDDLQHYTMVDKDSVKAKLIQFELEEYKQIKKDLERLEELEFKYENLRSDNIKLMEENSKLLIDNERLDIRICTLEELVNINRKIDELATKAVNENEKLKQENKELLVNKNVAQGIANKYKKALDILNKYPKMINESVRFDSPYGIQCMLGVSKEEAEEIKQGYRLLKEVLGYE